MCTLTCVCMNYRVSHIEMIFLKMQKNIQNKFFFVKTWTCFQENLIYFWYICLILTKNSQGEGREALWTEKNWSFFWNFFLLKITFWVDLWPKKFNKKFRKKNYRNFFGKFWNFNTNSLPTLPQWFFC